MLGVGNVLGCERRCFAAHVDSLCPSHMFIVHAPLCLYCCAYQGDFVHGTGLVWHPMHSIIPHCRLSLKGFLVRLLIARCFPCWFGGAFCGMLSVKWGASGKSVWAVTVASRLSCDSCCGVHTAYSLIRVLCPRTSCLRKDAHIVCRMCGAVCLLQLSLCVLQVPAGFVFCEVVMRHGSGLWATVVYALIPLKATS